MFGWMWLLGCVGTFMRQQSSGVLFFKPVFHSLQEVFVKHMARWRVVGDCRRLLCWLMVTEMTDNSGVDPSVSLLAKQSKDQTDVPWDAKSKSKPQGWFLPSSFHITLSSLSNLRWYWSESSFDLSYLWKAVWECDTNVNKSISLVAINSTGFLFLVTSPSMFCWSENK